MTSGSQSFAALKAALTTGRNPDCGPFEDLPFQRLRSVIPAGSTLDRAVLLRHALRHRQAQLGPAGLATLPLPDAPGWPDDRQCAACGLLVERPSVGMRLVSAVPWRPDWLEGSGDVAVDEAACAGTSRRTTLPVDGDPILRLVGHERYRSLGQRSAVRAALTAPPGSTLVVNLPTGEGKSLLFQVVDMVGYEDSAEGGSTLVVVPTVPLAYDHEHGLRRRGLARHALAYVGGQDVANGEIARRVEAGTQGLVFAAPEALVSGPLARAADAAARQGLLRALVIDEAHLVDGWGADFRPSFQGLSGVRRSLIAVSPCGREPRTLLLTATLTRGAALSLHTLFAGPGPHGIVSASHLRPEIDYWVAEHADRDERARRVLEALHHLPRPLILYVTRVQDATVWQERLGHLGFERLRCVHGGTPAAERAETVESWAAGRIDLVVATSAFGLGIDNANVRAVVHACVPETGDRFYQEVGRGGRDGKASVSLLVPADGDLGVARSINRRRLISVDKGHRRWTAMFRHADRVHDGPGDFTLRLDVPPAADERHIDMVSETSTDWSVKTLTLMAGAGLIELVGPAARGSAGAANVSGAGGVFQSVRTLEPSHADRALWERTVGRFRASGGDGDSASLRAMLSHLRDDGCPARWLAPLYEIPADAPFGPVAVARQCGTCSACRGRPDLRTDRTTGEPTRPWAWPARSGEAAREFVGAGNRLVVFYPDPRTSRGFGRRLQRTMARLISRGFRNVVAPPGPDLDWSEILRPPHRGPVFWQDRPLPNRLPHGPTVHFVPQGQAVEASGLRPYHGTATTEAPRIYLLPEGAEHPEMDRRRWKDVYVGNMSDFDALWARLNR